MTPSIIDQLQEIVRHQILQCRNMGIQVHVCDEREVIVRAPLAINLNHQQTAFAGSLNALCIAAGWGMVFAMVKRAGRDGDIVLRNSTIRYHKPVRSDPLVALCGVPSEQKRSWFEQMLARYGAAKLQLTSQIHEHNDRAVTFRGTYVVTLSDTDEPK